jgi:uncharacterized membrane protein
MSHKNKYKKKVKESEVVVESQQTSGSNTSDYLNDKYIQILIAITALGTILRFYNLSENSLWLDEASTISYSKESLYAIWQAGFAGDNNPPLFHWITHFMIELFGQSEFVLRFFPAIFGIVAIVVCYFIGKELTDDKNVGLITAGLIAVSPFCLNYAQEAYSYSLVLLASSIAILYYLRAIKHNTKTDWILFGLGCALAFWSHFYTFILIGLMCAHIIFINRDKILGLDIDAVKWQMAGFGLAGAISLPILYMAISRFMTLSSNPVTYGIQGIALLPETLYRFSGFNWYVAAIYLTLVICGMIYLIISDKKYGLLPAIFLTVPIIMSVLLSSKMTMNPRYLIYLIPIFFVTIASLYKLISKLIKDSRLVYIVLACLLVLNAIPVYNYYTTPRSEDWRGYSKYLSGITNPGDVVVVLPGYVTQPFDYYYNNKTDGTIEYGAYTAAELESTLSQKTTNNVYFVITSDIAAANPQGDATQWLESKTKLVRQYTGIYTTTV